MRRLTHSVKAVVDVARDNDTRAPFDVEKRAWSILRRHLGTGAGFRDQRAPARKRLNLQKDDMP
jgi:hypothetical protein